MAAEAGRSGGATSAHLSGARKCAILCLSLGPKEAARILQQLRPLEVEQVTREMVSMGTIPPDIVQQVLGDFEKASRLAATSVVGSRAYAQQVLREALGADSARQILEKIQERPDYSGLSRLRQAAPDVLSGLLQGEHPQTIALILTHLEAQLASQVIQQMDPELAGEVLYRIARMEKISPEMLDLIEVGLNANADIPLSKDLTTSGGPEAAAQLLNLTRGAVEERLMSEVERRSAELAGQVKALMFTFEDLLQVDSRGLQRVLREVEPKELALSLKAASDELKKHIMSAMSERARSAIEEEIELLGPVRVREVEAAHARIIEVVRKLEQDGEIMIQGRGNEDDIIP